MNVVNFSSMTTPQLVSFYNRHSTKQVKRFSDRKTAEKRCAELFSSLMSHANMTTMSQKTAPAGNTPRPVMGSSLKLNCTITRIETGETWKNAHQMWVLHPDWMTSSQQDRLTAQLYAAAKQGEQKQVVINERTFQLVNVPQVTE